MKFLIRVVVAAALAWLAVVLALEGREEYASEQPDHSRMLMIFGGVLLLAITLGIMVAMIALPALGDWIGSFFFNPSEQVEKDPHADAIARIAHGDYEGAIEEYRAAYEEDPSDTLALSEIARLCCDKLGDPARGAEGLEQALGQDLRPDDAAFLCSRLVDIRWSYQHDAESAIYLLNQIMETMPETKQAANAQHRLHEIERSLPPSA